jgi:hypothetical protein
MTVEERLSRLESKLDQWSETMSKLAIKLESMDITANASPIDPMSSASNVVPMDGNGSTEKIVDKIGSVSNAMSGGSSNADQIRVKAEDFPLFDGSFELDKDVNFWLQHVEMLGGTYGPNGLAEHEYRKIAIRNFVGEAKEKLHSAMGQFNSLSTWSETKRFLRELCGDPGYRDKIFIELSTRLILPYESLAKYWNFYRYLVESSIRIGGKDESTDRAFREGRIAWALDHLPPTFSLEVRQRWTEIRDKSNLEAFGRILMSEAVSRVRMADGKRELELFLNSEFFNNRREQLHPMVRKYANEKGWAMPSLQIRQQHSGMEYSRRPPPARTNGPTANKRLVMYAESGPFRGKPGGFRKFKCVCGGEHRYCDCSKPEGKAKCAEIQKKLKTRPGVNMIAEDGEIYWIDEAEADQSICFVHSDEANESDLENYSETQLFPNVSC